MVSDTSKCSQKESSVPSSHKITSILDSEKPKIPNEACEAQVEPDTLAVEQQLSRWKLVLLTVALCSSIFCVSLDGTILATAIPVITTEFGSLDDVAWYGSAYLFCTCSVQLMFGKLYTFYATKWVFFNSIIVFELGSLICGVAPTSTTFIIGRSISGLGAGGIFSGGIIIIAQTVPLRMRPIYTGLLSSMHGVASVAGPILGGTFTDHVTWRWCFYINLPLGGIAVTLLFLFLPGQAHTTTLGWREKLKQFDLPGTLFLVPAVISLLLALQWGGSAYSWKDARVIALFVVFGILFAIFIGIQWWQESRATVPFHIIKNRNIWGGVWYGVFMGASLFVFTYYLPIWFQAIKGVSATQSGIDTLPSLIGLVIFAIIGGGLASAIGYYTPLLLTSSIITSIGAGLFITLKVDSTIGYWFGYQILLSAGAGLGAQNVMLVAQMAVPIPDMAMAISILTFTQTLSSAIFLPVGQSVFQNRLVLNLRSIAPGVNSSLVLQSGATSIRDNFAPDELPRVLEAYNQALVQTFYVAAGASATSILGPIVMEWLSLKSKTQVDDHKDESS